MGKILLAVKIILSGLRIKVGNDRESNTRNRQSISLISLSFIGTAHIFWNQSNLGLALDLVLCGISNADLNIAFTACPRPWGNTRLMPETEQVMPMGWIPWAANAVRV